MTQFIAGENLDLFEDEYDPRYPNEYEKVLKKMAEKLREKERVEKEKEEEERRKRRESRHAERDRERDRRGREDRKSFGWWLLTKTLFYFFQTIILMRALVTLEFNLKYSKVFTR